MCGICGVVSCSGFASPEAARLRRELEGERAKLAVEAEKLEKERARVGSSFRDELERLRDDVGRQLTNELKRLRELDRSARASVKAADAVRSITSPFDKAMEFLPAEEGEVHVGDRAQHRKFKVTGQVVSIDGSKAVLNVNGRKMTVDTGDLVAVGGGAISSPQRSRRPVTAGSSDIAEVSAELNLIGQRVDEALDESDRFLDRSLLEGRQAVRIIHGFGTGRLRSAIREHLRKHPAVKSFRPGEENEGGDGATVALLS